MLFYTSRLGLCLSLGVVGAAWTGDKIGFGSESQENLASVDEGLIQGFSDGARTILKGIPFAAPPVGTLPWSPPQAPAKWDGLRQATETQSWTS